MLSGGKGFKMQLQNEGEWCIAYLLYTLKVFHGWGWCKFCLYEWVKDEIARWGLDSVDMY